MKTQNTIKFKVKVVGTATMAVLMLLVTGCGGGGATPSLNIQNAATEKASSGSLPPGIENKLPTEPEAQPTTPSSIITVEQNIASPVLETIASQPPEAPVTNVTPAPEANTAQPPAPQPQTNPKKGTWCDVKLDKVIYGTGETLVTSFSGYNEESTPVKCGVKVNLAKGKDHPEQWRSDFAANSTYITIAPNSSASGVVHKVIPDSWAMTSSKQGSDYRVYTIREDGRLWEKGDNFNILKKRDCTNKKHCDDDIEPPDGGGTVPPDEGGTTPPEPPACTIACSSDAQCDDGIPFTLDTCELPGTCDSYCLSMDGL